MTEHVHRWGERWVDPVRGLARLVTGTTAEPGETHVVCTVCGVRVCSGRIPSKRGSVWACHLEAGRAGPCHNPNMPPDQRYRPPAPPPAPSPVPAAPAPAAPGERVGARS